VTANGVTIRSVSASALLKLTTIDSTGATLFEVTVPSMNLPGTIRYTGAGMPIELISQRPLISLSVLSADKLFGVQSIDLRQPGVNTLLVIPADIRALNAGKRLRVLMDAQDALVTSPTWLAGPGRVENGSWVQPYAQGEATLEVISARPWRNEVARFDVDGDRGVSPLDVLALINAINGNVFPGGALPARSNSSPQGFFDPDGDESLSPLDVLSVVNELNRGGGGGEGEGEGEDETYTNPCTLNEQAVDALMTIGLAEELSGRKRK
jgi:hypothetical protein